MEKKEKRRETREAALPPATGGPAPTPPTEWPRRPVLAGALVMLAFTLGLFGDMLFDRGDRVLSAQNGDIYFQYAAWRDFGFGHLRQGHVPLWNPHIYSGTPYFGGFQSGLFYPLNAFYLFLPLARAINVGIALHVFLAGLFMFLWARQRGLHFLACVLAGVLWMFCAPHIMHVYPGHLGGLIETAWIPALFLTIDRFLARRSAEWVLAGVGVAAMMLLGGDPQYVFFVAIAAGMYCLVYLVRTGTWPRLLAGLIIMGAGGAALAAVQLAPGLAATGESIRSGPLPYSFAASFSFPPENALTLLAPTFFGGPATYWGRFQVWEVSLFFGIFGLTLAAYGLWRGQGRFRWLCLAMAMALWVLALGRNTPLYRVLYEYMPLINRFRGMSKFIVPAAAFLALLSAIGADAVARRRGGLGRVAMILAGAGAVMIAVGLTMRLSGFAPEWWSQMMLAKADDADVFTDRQLLRDPAWALQMYRQAALALLMAGGTALTGGAALAVLRSWRHAAVAVVALAAAEVFIFAWTVRDTFSISKTKPAGFVQFFEKHPGDYRTLNRATPNLAMRLGTSDIWGYGPLMPRRYCEWFAVTQKVSPDRATPGLSRVDYHPIHRMVRCRFEVVAKTDRTSLREWPGALPRAMILHECRVIAGRDAVLAAVMDPSFNPERTVVLETAPDPPPEPSEVRGAASIVEQGTDHLVIEADLPKAGILLVTDSYSRDWRVRSLEGSAQTHYDVLPANYVLRAVPLTAGRHRLRMEYDRSTFHRGAWVSAVAMALYLAGAGVCLFGRRKSGD